MTSHLASSFQVMLACMTSHFNTSSFQVKLACMTSHLASSSDVSHLMSSSQSIVCITSHLESIIPCKVWLYYIKLGEQIPCKVCLYYIKLGEQIPCKVCLFDIHWEQIIQYILPTLDFASRFVDYMYIHMLSFFHTKCVSILSSLFPNRYFSNYI